MLGIIPVRGGSKGVPGKNIKPLGGKPLLYYTIDAALNSKLLATSIVSTDSEEIAKIARDRSITVPFLRPASLAQDGTPTLPVIQHALQYFIAQGISFDAVCLLQATSPFRKKGLIDEAIQKFTASNCDAIVSVLPVPHEYNPHWVFEPKEDGLLRISTGEEKIIPRRQELPKAYFRDGAIYITRTEIILKENSLLGRKLSYIENDPEWHVNIDTLEDWERAEKKVDAFREICVE